MCCATESVGKKHTRQTRKRGRNTRNKKLEDRVKEKEGSRGKKEGKKERKKEKESFRENGVITIPVTASVAVCAVIPDFWSSGAKPFPRGS